MLKKDIKKLDYIFEKRFNKKTNISLKKNANDYCHELLKCIEKEYRLINEEHKNNGDNEYIIREKINVEAFIKNLEGENFAPKYIGILISSIIPISIFMISKPSENFINSFKFSIESRLKNVSDVMLTDSISKIFDNYTNEMSRLILHHSISLIVLIGFGLLAFEIIENYFKSKLSKQIIFNKMCLDILNKI